MDVVDVWWMLGGCPMDDLDAWMMSWMYVAWMLWMSCGCLMDVVDVAWMSWMPDGCRIDDVDVRSGCLMDVVDVAWM